MRRPSNSKVEWTGNWVLPASAEIQYDQFSERMSAPLDRRVAPDTGEDRCWHWSMGASFPVIVVDHPK